MKRFSKVALGAIALAVGVGGISISIHKTAQVNGAAAASPYSISFGSGNGLAKYVSGTTSYASGGVTWTIANVPEYVSNDSSDWHLGSGKKALQDFSLSAGATNFGTGIISVAVVLWGGSSNTISISGNGTSAISKTAVPASEGTITANFGTPVSAGDLVITLNENNSQKSATYLKSISVTYATGDVKATGIALSQTSLSGFVGGSGTLTATVSPSNTTHGLVDWSSNNPAIATVEAGTVSFVAIGNAIITAAVHDDPTLKATCTVTVVAAETYSLVTSLNDIHLGAEVVFVNKTSSKAMADQIINSSYMDQTAVTVGTSSIGQVTHIGLFTFGIGAVKDTYTFKNTADSKYLTAGSSGTALILSTSESDSTDWSISLGEDGLATVMANNRYLFYNTTYSDFASSTTAPATGKEIYLYQKAAATGQLDTVEATGTLTKSTYKPGDVFDASGLTVNGMFNDADTTIVDLTKWVVWPTTLIVLGQTSVEGSVTVQGVTKTIVENITVEEVTLTKIEITTPATTTTFLLGGTLDTTGLVVTATYSNSTTEDVTTKCTITPANGSTLSTAGTTAVEIAYLGKTTSYNVTVETAAHVLKKITSVDQLVIGAEIVIASDDTNLVAMSSTQNTNNRGQAAISPASNSLSLLASSTAAVFTLGAGTKNESYSLRDTNGYLYAASSSGNYLRSQSTLDANGSWAITVTAEGVATITAQGSYTHNLLQYNASSSLFSCYSSAQKNVVLYEQTTYYNAGSWASGFNTALDATCSNTAPTAIASSTWSEQNTSFSNLGTDEKAILKDLSTADANDGTAAKKAMSRYDYVMGKAAYSSFADFIGRFPSRTPSSAATSLNADKANPMIPLAVLVAGAGATGLIFLAKKKKHD